MADMGKRWWVVGTVAAVAVVFLLLPAPVRAGDKIQVRTLAEGKKVIPVTCSIGNWQITDIKLPDLVVTNGRQVPVTVEGVEVVGSVARDVALRLVLPEAALSAAIRETALWLNGPGTPIQAVRLSLGNVVLPEGPLSEDGRVWPGQSVLLPLSKVAFLHHVGHEVLDGLEVRIALRFAGRQKVVTFPVGLTPYASRGTYDFPVKGDLQMAFLPLSYIHHRSSTSQEFAMDLVAANAPDGEAFTDMSCPEPGTLSDYAIWGREVLSMGDGVVVETGDRFPEARMSDPDLFGDQSYVSALIRELIPIIGWTNSVAGNYVIVDHGNGEFGAYCHLQEGSLLVEPGQRVARGQALARVGNTGNSGAPHLHFQLMDSADFFTANGLPMTFGDVPAQVMVNEFPVTANTLSFSDGIFRAVP